MPSNVNDIVAGGAELANVIVTRAFAVEHTTELDESIPETADIVAVLTLKAEGK